MATATTKSARTTRRRPAARSAPDVDIGEYLDRLGSQAGTPLESLPVDDRVLSLVADDLTGDNLDIAVRRELDEARQKCRDGNPFPLIALQWPELVIEDDHVDASIFRGNLREVENQPIIDDLKQVIFDPSNPLLRLDWWQYVAIAGTFSKRIGEVYLAGGSGVGKGMASCLAVNLWYDVHDEAKIHLTGTNRDRCRSQVYAEVMKWKQSRKSDISPPKTENHYIEILNPNLDDKKAPEKFSGAHGPATFFLLDEATVHPDSWIENARRPAMKVFALANPRSTWGWFYDAFKSMHDDEKLIAETVPGPLRLLLRMRIGGSSCLNVRYNRLRVPVAPLGGIQIREDLHPCVA